MIITLGKNKSKIKIKDTLGFMPEVMAKKSYMQIYHNHHDYEVIEDQSLGFVKIKIGKPKFLKSVGKFVSRAIRDVAKIAKPITRIVKDVGEVTEDAYDVAKKVAVKALPPQLRRLASDSLLSVEKLVTDPVSSVKMITQSSVDIASNIVRESTNAVEIAYKDVARPGFRLVRNVARESVWKPVHKVVDVAVLPILPSSIRDKVEKIIDIPDMAWSGKLTDKTILEGLKASYQLNMIPFVVASKIQSEITNALRKDAILGPFIATLDTYSGGVLTSAQNLNNLPDKIYYDRQIDWKQTIIDGLKVYLAAVSVKSMLSNMAVAYIGDETGLSQTSLGRGVILASQAYAGAVYGGADWNNIATAGNAAKAAALSTAKTETVKHAVANGWVDDKQTASLILSAGGKFYNTAGTDKTMLDALDEAHDKEFQKYFNAQVEKKLGVPLTYAHLAAIYNSDWSKMTDNIIGSMKKMAPVFGTSDGQFLEKMGKNFVDEMRRLPKNFSNISEDVLKEIERSPENLMNLASNIANEAARTPENIAKISENIAKESVRGASNIVEEIKKTPDNISNITDNIITETGVLISNVVDEAVRTPGNITEIVSNVSISPPGSPKIDFNDLLIKYGPTLIKFLNLKYPNFNPYTSTMPDYIYDDIDANFINFDPNLGKKSKAPIFIAGLIGVAALAYLAQDE